MKKRRLTCGLLGTAMALSLAGCSGSSSADKEKSTAADSAADSKAEGTEASKEQGGPSDLTTDNITLTYWHYEDETTINMLAEKFMEKYPNITVEAKVITDMSTDLSAAAAAGTFPDVFSGTDSDTALANAYWADISEYFDADPETKNLLPTIAEYGIGCFDTSKRFAVPTWYQPSAIFIDRNVIEHLNLDMPRTDWTWSEMIDLIKKATVDDRTGMKYYGLGYYNRMDSLYGIAACSPEERGIKGEFGFDGNDFDLSYWAVGEQDFADLKLGGYVAPQQDTQEMEDWSGDWSTWFGSTAHVAVFSEGFWSYQNIWGLEGYQEEFGLDIVPYVTPNVIDEKEHNIIANMYMGGVSTSCEHKREAYELLKFMSFGVDGWNARMDIYEDSSITNSAGTPLKSSNMPVPITLDEGVWSRFKNLFPTDEDHKPYWDDYFASITRPVAYGWYTIAGYWNFCDQYFNSIGIHDLVDGGKAKAADYVEEATRQANYYHAEAMLSYFGEGSPYSGVYGTILSDEDIAKYEAVVASFTK